MKPNVPTQSTTTHVCCYCGKTLPESQLYFIEEEYWLCDHCMREYTTTCSHCGESILLDNNAGSSETPLCNACYDDHYNTCVRCGRVIHTDDTYYRDRYDDDPYCYECYSCFERDGGIQDYYYKPDPIFYGSGSRYFGVELEIDEAGESDYNAEQVMSVGNRDAEHIYCKHDGSLHDGFEIVTHPMTLNYHMDKMPWADVLKEARKAWVTYPIKPGLADFTSTSIEIHSAILLRNRRLTSAGFCLWSRNFGTSRSNSAEELNASSTVGLLAMGIRTTLGR